MDSHDIWLTMMTKEIYFTGQHPSLSFVVRIYSWALIECSGTFGSDWWNDIKARMSSFLRPSLTGDTVVFG